MPKLLIQEVAKRKDVTLTQLYTALVALRASRPRPPEKEKERLALGTVRRYWYGTRNGNTTGDPLRLVDVVLLRDIADVLGVRAADLIDYSVEIEGQLMGAGASV